MLIANRAFAGLMIAMLAVASGEVRTWTDTSGKFKIEAEFVALERGSVTLRTASGETRKLPLDKLSAADRKMAEELAAPANAKLENEKSIEAIEKLGGEFQKERSMLSLIKSRVTDADLVHLKGLIELEYLFLDPKTTDAWLVHLKGLTNLKGLHLQDTKITDDGMVHLKGLTDLRVLTLSDTEITGEGFAHLKEMTKLKSLMLSNSPITDTGLAYLEQLTWLRLLTITIHDAEGNRVHAFTESGLNRFKAAVPKCMVIR